MPCRKLRVRTRAICSAASKCCGAQDKITEAAQWLLAAPRDPAKVANPDPWWVERRLIARKLLDLGDAKMAYDVANGAAPPNSDNFRAEQHFTAGWIALRFLRDPGIAMAHFARIADGATNPITLGALVLLAGARRGGLGPRPGRARRCSRRRRIIRPPITANWRARRLGLDEVTLRELPDPSPDHRMLELARVFEILYAIDNRDLIASMAADLGDKATDIGALVTLADIAARHNDARAVLLIGKPALGRGYPMERYAFPNFGVPDYQPIGPPVEPCVVYSIVRQESAFNPRVVSSANAIGLMQVTPAGRPRHRQAIWRHLRPAPADGRRHLQCAARQRRTRQRYRDLARLLHPRLLRLQCRAAPGQGMDRAIRRSARSQSRPDRLDRAHPDLGNAQLRRSA